MRKTCHHRPRDLSTTTSSRWRDSNDSPQPQGSPIQDALSMHLARRNQHFSTFVTFPMCDLGNKYDLSASCGCKGEARNPLRFRIKETTKEAFL